MTENLDSFEILTDVGKEYNLGYYYIEEAGIYDMPQVGNLVSCINYERCGRDVALEEVGDSQTKAKMWTISNKYAKITSLMLKNHEYVKGGYYGY